MDQEHLVAIDQKVIDRDQRESIRDSHLLIETATLNFLLEAIDPLVLPPYKGSTFRGALGSSLRRITCKTDAPICRDCDHATACVYSYIFNTPPPPGSDRMKKAETAPHPFVIEPPLEEKQFYNPGDRLAFGLLLIGRGIELAEIFIEAIESMGERGLGNKKESRGRVRITSIKNSEKRDVISRDALAADLPRKQIPIDRFPTADFNRISKSDFAISFITPARFCIDQQPIGPRDFTFSLLIRHLVRRISLVDYFHGSGGRSGWNAHEIIEAADRVRIRDNNLSWFDWERFSTTQNKRMALGGLVGNAVFDSNVEPFLPFLRAGEVLHVGKNTTFGLGKYFLNNSIGDRYGYLS